MGPLVLVFAFVLGMSLLAARALMGTLSRKDKPTRPPKRKPARKSAPRKRKSTQKAQPRRRYGMDDEDLLELIFDNALGGRNKRK